MRAALAARAARMWSPCSSRHSRPALSPSCAPSRRCPESRRRRAEGTPCLLLAEAIRFTAAERERERVPKLGSNLAKAILIHLAPKSDPKVHLCVEWISQRPQTGCLGPSCPIPNYAYIADYTHPDPRGHENEINACKLVRRAYTTSRTPCPERCLGYCHSLSWAPKTAAKRGSSLRKRLVFSCRGVPLRARLFRAAAVASLARPRSAGQWTRVCARACVLSSATVSIRLFCAEHR